MELPLRSCFALAPGCVCGNYTFYFFHFFFCFLIYILLSFWQEYYVALSPPINKKHFFFISTNIFGVTPFGLRFNKTPGINEISPDFMNR